MNLLIVYRCWRVFLFVRAGFCSPTCQKRAASSQSRPPTSRTRRRDQLTPRWSHQNLGKDRQRPLESLVVLVLPVTFSCVSSAAWWAARLCCCPSCCLVSTRRSSRSTLWTRSERTTSTGSASSAWTSSRTSPCSPSWAFSSTSQRERTKSYFI